ncbi:MAG: hypothetical protein ACOYL6_10360 [Bacteriovoracaceae bacterium]
MKRSLISILFLFISLAASAGSNQSFLVDGSQNQLAVDLKGDVFRTEYRIDQVPSTCYHQSTEIRRECVNVPRQNCVPGQQVCQTVNQQRCRNVPPVCRPVCHQGPQGEICKNVCSDGAPQCETVAVNQCSPGAPICRQYISNECYDTPIVRRQPYACTETVRTPFQVVDHSIEAHGRFKFAGAPKGVKLIELFTFEIVNDDVVLSVKSSKNVLINSTKTAKVTSKGDVKIIDADFIITFIDLKNMKDALTSITDLGISNNQLSYSIGATTNLKFKHIVTLKQKKLLGKKTLVDRALNEDEIDSINENGKQKYSIDLIKLDIVVKERTHFVRVEIKPDLDAFTNILNKDDILSLRLSKEDKIKL